MGRDHTLFALVAGKVAFDKLHRKINIEEVVAA
jgi:ribosomal protein L27